MEGQAFTSLNKRGGGRDIHDHHPPLLPIREVASFENIGSVISSAKRKFQLHQLAKLALILLNQEG